MTFPQGRSLPALLALPAVLQVTGAAVSLPAPFGFFGSQAPREAGSHQRMEIGKTETNQFLGQPPEELERWKYVPTLSPLREKPGVGDFFLLIKH